MKKQRHGGGHGGQRSFVVIGFVVQDGHGTVDLLGEEQAYHLVREGHQAE